MVWCGGAGGERVITRRSQGKHSRLKQWSGEEGRGQGGTGEGAEEGRLPRTKEHTHCRVGSEGRRRDEKIDGLRGLRLKEEWSREQELTVVTGLWCGQQMNRHRRGGGTARGGERPLSFSQRVGAARENETDRTQSIHTQNMIRTEA